jgi:hypothetical protein
MNCPKCGAKISDVATQCPFCGQEIQFKHRHISYGKIGISFAFAGLIIVLFILFIFRLLQSDAYPLAQFFSSIVLLLSTLSIVFGSIAFFGKTKDILGLISLFLGICLLAGLIIGLSLTGIIFFKTNVSIIGNPLLLSCFH